MLESQNRYAGTSREFMAEALEYLARNNLAQASEKGWGAAAQMVKAVAQDRGWQHDSHYLLYQTVNRLAEETGDRQIVTLFGHAGNLHTNFYENWQPPETVAVGIQDVEQLLDKLEPLL